MNPGALARSLKDFITRTNCHLLLDPRGGIQVGSIYQLDTATGKGSYMDELINYVEPKQGSVPFQYPEKKYPVDSSQVINSSDFCDLQLQVSYFDNLIAKVGALIRFRRTKKEQLVSFFLENTIEDISIAKLRRSVANYKFADESIFRCSPSGSIIYRIVIQARMSKKCAVCSSSGSSKNLQALQQLATKLQAEVNREITYQDFLCNWTPASDKNGLTYAVKLAPIECDQTTRDIIINDPLINPDAVMLSGYESLPPGITKDNFVD